MFRRALTLRPNNGDMRLMQLSDRINAIEARARTINLTLSEVCKASDVHLSTVLRWRNGEVDPRLGKADATCARLEAALAERERVILSELSNRVPPCGRTQRPAA